MVTTLQGGGSLSFVPVADGHNDGTRGRGRDRGRGRGRGHSKHGKSDGFHDPNSPPNIVGKPSYNRLAPCPRPSPFGL